MITEKGKGMMKPMRKQLIFYTQAHIHTQIKWNLQLVFSLSVFFNFEVFLAVYFTLKADWQLYSLPAAMNSILSHLFLFLIYLTFYFTLGAFLGLIKYVWCCLSKVLQMSWEENISGATLRGEIQAGDKLLPLRTKSSKSHPWGNQKEKHRGEL